MVASDHPYEVGVDLLQSTLEVVLAAVNRLLMGVAVAHYHQNDNVPNQRRIAVAVKEVHDDVVVADVVPPSDIAMSKVMVKDGHTCLWLQGMIRKHEQC